MINDITESDYDRMRYLSRKLGIPFSEVFLEFTLVRANGEVVKIRDRSHTWTRNMYNMAGFQISALASSDTSTWGDGHLNAKTTGGTLVGLSCASQATSPAATDVSKGIVLGSGTTAWSFDDYKLDTAIAHGTSSGQLYYYGQNVLASWLSTTTTWCVRLDRTCINQSGGNVSVNEVVYIGNLNTTPNMGIFTRDVLSSTVTVAAGEQLTVAYVFTTALPA